MVVGDGEGHQLVKAHGLGPVVGQQARRHVGEFQTALHHQRRDAEIRCNVLDAAAFGHERGERLELVGGVHGFALHVLGEAGRAGGAIGHQQARHLPFLANAVLFRQQLQRCEATVTGHDLVMLAIGGGNHDEVLQQADTLDAGGEFGNGHARGLAHVAASGTRHQPRQRNQNQVLGRISGFQRDSGGGVDGAGFGLGNGVHGDNSYRFRDAAAKKATRAAACPCRVGIQAFNWRMPSASSQRARFSRMFWSMPCTGRVCCRRPLALRPRSPPWVRFSWVRLNTPTGRGGGRRSGAASGFAIP